MVDSHSHHGAPVTRHVCSGIHRYKVYRLLDTPGQSQDGFQMRPVFAASYEMSENPSRGSQRVELRSSSVARLIAGINQHTPFSDVSADRHTKPSTVVKWCSRTILDAFLFPACLSFLFWGSDKSSLEEFYFNSYFKCGPPSRADRAAGA